jgi:flagellar assembly factor FliW
MKNTRKKTERLTTPRFGVVAYTKSDLYRFPKGLVGLPDLKRFVMLTLDDSAIFRCLQSVDDPARAFVVVDPILARADYRVAIDATIAEEIGLADLADAVVLAIAVVPEDVTRTTLNLKGPLVINTRTRTGVQLVHSETEYGVREPLVEAPASEEHEIHA